MVSRAAVLADQAAEHFSNPVTAGKLFVPNFARNAIESNNNLGFEYDSEEEAFPPVNPGLAPMGNLVLVMMRQPKLRSNAGLDVGDYNRKAEMDNNQVAKVIAVGPLAFRNRQTGDLWPEGTWCAVGDYVRVPKFQGDYFQVAYQRVDHEVDDRTGKRREFPVRDRLLFAQFKDIALLGKYPDAATALAVKAFL
jgi:co-chaperonin GroES (HSP10)